MLVALNLMIFLVVFKTVLVLLLLLEGDVVDQNFLIGQVTGHNMLDWVFILELDAHEEEACNYQEYGNQYF